MAHFVFTNGYFSWNAVVLSDHVREVHLRTIGDFVEDVTMGSIIKKRMFAIGDWELEIVMSQDFAASEVDATLSPDIGPPPLARAWAARGDAGAISTTNPEYQGTGFIQNYEPINGAFGEVLGTRITVVPSTNVALVRDVTP
jgi:hypothetical protein